MRIDLNSDLGEGCGADEALMPLITSANVACGGHAGDAATMAATIALAQRHGVAIGAHPGFPDRAHFGRRELPLSAAEIIAVVTEQLQTLRALVPLRHVKPHGALYNLAARRAEVAEALAAAVRRLDPTLILVGLAGSELVRAGRAAGLRVAEEVFADRSYQPDGTLTPRGVAGAVLTSPDEAAARALRIVQTGRIPCVDGTERPVQADTLCLHGDQPGAVLLARRLREVLAAGGVAVRALE